MIKQISVTALAVAAITGIVYLAYDHLTCDKDEAEAPKEDSQEAEAPEEDPREELRSVLYSIASTMYTAKDEANHFLGDLPSAIKDTEKGKVVTFLVGTAVVTGAGQVDAFLASSYEYPFDELSDEEVLDVLAEAREQDAFVCGLLKEVRNVITHDYSEVA